MNTFMKSKVISEWVDNKIEDLCRTVRLFVEYLTLPRPGFIKVERIKLTLAIIKYVVEEIYNCKSVSSTPFTTVSTNFSSKIITQLKKINENIIIEEDVVKYIWNYIIFGVKSLTEGINIEEEVKEIKSRKRREITNEYKKKIQEKYEPKPFQNLESKKDVKKTSQYSIIREELNKELNEKLREIDTSSLVEEQVLKRADIKIQTKIKAFQLYISQKSCEQHSFDRDIDKCILQSLVYLIVTLTDWLEVNYVTEDEIFYALKILLPPDFSHVLQNNYRDIDDKFNVYFIKELTKYNLRVRGDDYDKLSIVPFIFKEINKVNPQEQSYQKFNNRVRYFANTL